MKSRAATFKWPRRGCRAIECSPEAGVKGAAAPLRGAGRPRPDPSFRAWGGGALNGPDEDVKGLTLEQIPVILSDKQKNTRSNEQEEYIARHGYRESALVESRSGAAMEWACKLRSERRGTPRQVVLLRCVPRYRGQDMPQFLLLL